MIIFEWFLQMLSTFHYTMTSEKDLVNLSSPNTTSFLYEFNQTFYTSLDPKEEWLRNFFFHGYPYDTFAVHYVKHKSSFATYLQLMLIAMVVCFSIMFLFLGYYMIAGEEISQLEFEETMKKIRDRNDTIVKEEKDAKTI